MKDHLLKPGSVYDSISFSGAGWGLPFHFGVVKCLKDHNIRFKKAVGASSGICGALALLDLAHLDLGIRQCYDLHREATIGPFGNVLSLYGQYYERFLHHDAHKRHKGRVFATYSEFPLRKVMLNEFNSRDHLLHVGIFGCLIPGLFGIAPRRSRGRFIFDAVFIDNFPVIDQKTVLVTPVHERFISRKRKMNRLIISSPLPLRDILFNRHIGFIERAFVQGYIACLLKIAGGKTEYSSPHRIKKVYRSVLKKHQGWKSKTY
jgi:patatin-like phospholipase